MNHKLSIDNYFTATGKPQMTTASLHIKKKANDALNKITESLFCHYKQSANNPKRRKPFDYKSNNASIITKPFQIKGALIHEDNKLKRKKSKETSSHCHHRSKNTNESQSLCNTLNSNYNFVSHNKNKSTGMFISNTSYSKDKGTKAGHDVTRKCSKEKDGNIKGKDRNENMRIKLTQKLTVGMGSNNNKNMIKNYLLNNYNAPTNINITNNKSPRDGQSGLDNQKKNSDQHHHDTNNNKKISRSNSISNLDQSTKTSTEATTTTSKRFYDQILKSTSNKPSALQISSNNNKMNHNLSSFYLNQFSTKPLHKKKVNKRNNHLNNSILNQLQTINKTMTNQHQMNILNTEETMTQSIKHKIGSNIVNPTPSRDSNEQNGIKTITEPLFDKSIRPKGRTMKLNDTGSLSLLSEDSVFNYSKHRSTSGNNNNNINNSLAYQNDSISFKRSSHKHSSSNNSNTLDKRSLSKDKLSSETNEVDPTVSYTYSDDEITGRKSKKTRRNVQRGFNNEDFLTFYAEMNQKLFGYNQNIK